MRGYPSEVLKVTENRIWGQKSASELFITQFKDILINTGLCKWLFYQRALDMKRSANSYTHFSEIDTACFEKKSKLYFKQLQKRFSIPFALQWSTFLVPKMLTCRVNHDLLWQKTEHIQYRITFSFEIMIEMSLT